MKLPKVKINFVLTLVLVLILLWEFYLGYTYIFRNFVQEDPQVVPSNIVRVNLESYRKTIDFLEARENFTPDSINLSRSNPFRP